MPEVSVIIPAYNSERFLRDAIGSVVRQTYRDWELIIVDDGSTDHTGPVAAAFARRLPGKVRCVSQANRGVGAARNLGLRHSCGGYVAFLDADDVWLPEKLERQVNALENDPEAGMAYCDNYFVDIDRRVLAGYERKVTLYEGHISPELFEHCFILTSGAVLRRKGVEAVGRFKEHLAVGEDYDYFLRLSHHFRIIFVKDKLFERRMLTTSLSASDYVRNAVSDLALLTGFVRERPEFYVRYRQRVRRRLGEYYFSLAYYSLRTGKNRFALRHLVNSMRYRMSVKAVKCMAMSLFPYEFLRLVRRKVFARGEAVSH